MKTMETNNCYSHTKLFSNTLKESKISEIEDSWNSLKEIRFSLFVFGFESSIIR